MYDITRLFPSVRRNSEEDSNQTLRRRSVHNHRSSRIIRIKIIPFVYVEISEHISSFPRKTAKCNDFEFRIVLSGTIPNRSRWCVGGVDSSSLQMCKSSFSIISIFYLRTAMSSSMTIDAANFESLSNDTNKLVVTRDGINSAMF